MEDTLLGEHGVPKGTVFVASCWNVQNNPSVWEKPERFDPERFAPDKMKSMHQYAALSRPTLVPPQLLQAVSKPPLPTPSTAIL